MASEQIVTAKTELRKALTILEQCTSQLTDHESNSLRASARALLAIVDRIPVQLTNRSDPQDDAVAMLIAVQNEIRSLNDTIARCPADLADATTTLIKIVERLVNGTLMSGASFHDRTLWMQGPPEAVDVHQLISRFKPFLELSMELAGSSPSVTMQQEIRAIKVSNDNMMKNNDIMTTQLKEQNALLRAQLSEGKMRAEKEKLDLEEKIRCAEHRNLVYDIVANAERMFADEHNAFAQTIFEGYRLGTYTPEILEKAFNLQSDDKHSEVKALTWSIKDIKDQRLSSGHSSIELQENVKVSELVGIAKKYFSLTHRQISLYEKIIQYTTRRYKELNDKNSQDDVTVAEIMRYFE